MLNRDYIMYSNINKALYTFTFRVLLNTVPVPPFKCTRVTPDAPL